MQLNKAQLMDVPGGPGVTGSVKAGSGVSISPDGTMSLDPAQVVTKVVAGTEIEILPTTGIGEVTVSRVFPPEVLEIFGDTPIPLNTQMFFYQETAPSGWTKLTTDDDTALRVVSGTGGSSGGTQPFTTTFVSKPVTGNISVSLSPSWNTSSSASITPSGNISVSGSVGNTSVTLTQLPSHSHQYNKPIWSVPQPGSQYLSKSPKTFFYNAATGNGGSSGGNGVHTHSLAGSGSLAGSASSHSHNVTGSIGGSMGFTGTAINLAVKYANFIVCRRTG